MADPALFAEEDFDLKRWINDALQNGKSPQDSIDTHAGMILMKLQVLSLDITSSLEDTSLQAVSNIPRALREIERVRKEAVLLKGKLDEFEHKLCEAEEGTENSIRMLADLDKIKTKMDFCCQALKESEKLGRLLGGVEDVFSTSDFQKIADQIKEMQQSLQTLSHLPEYSQTTRDLHLYEDRLEGMVRPHLLRAFNQRQLDTAKQYLSILESIDRAHQAQEHYFGCAAVEIEQLWESFTGTERSFLQWAPKFYDQLLVLIDSELSWSSKLFANKSIVTSLLHHVLGKLNASFKSRLEGLSLEDLINLYEKTTNFSTNACALLAGGGYTREQIDEAMTSFFAPYFHLQRQYPQLEKHHLTEQTSLLLPKKDEEVGAILRRIEESVEQLFLYFDESIQRCVQFTQGSEAEGLVRTISDVLSDYIKQLFTILRTLRVKARLDLTDVPPASSPSTSAADVTEFPTSASSQEWANIQAALKLLETVNALSSRLSTFDRSLRNQLMRQKTVLFGNNPHLNLTSQTIQALPCIHLRTEAEKAKRLKTFFLNLEDVAVKLLPTPAQLLMSFNTSVQSFVFDTMFVFIKDRFMALPSMKEWATEPDNTSFGISLPVFSLSPLGYATQIGDYLLTLPQALEPFSKSHNMRKDEYATSVGADSKKILASNIDDDELSLQVTTEGIDDQKSSSVANNEEEEQSGFIGQWISAICKGAMSLYLQRITEIKTLTDYGANQLKTDIEYLCNLISALNVPPDPALVQIQKFLVAPAKEYSIMLRTAEGSIKKMASLLANIRDLKDL